MRSKLPYSSRFSFEDGLAGVVHLYYGGGAWKAAKAHCGAHMLVLPSDGEAADYSWPIGIFLGSYVIGHGCGLVSVDYREGIAMAVLGVGALMFYAINEGVENETYI